MSMKRRIAKLENETRLLQGDGIKIIKLNNDDVKEIIRKDLHTSQKADNNNKNIEFDLSQVSDEMLDEYEKYLKKVIKKGALK